MDNSDNPFIRYRSRLDSYRPVAEGALSDDRFVELIAGLDAEVAKVEGRTEGGFAVTPLVKADALAKAIGIDQEIWIKDDTGNVAGSHKGRHLFGTALRFLVDEELGASAADRLAIASCGNAALAAGVIAAALHRRLEVFVPEWADESIVARLDQLEAVVTRCPRQPHESGDPAYLRFREAVADGAQSFSVQGTDTPSAFDGGRTLGWEVADQIPGGVSPDDHLYLQVGGGAMATSFSQGIGPARLFPVQAEGCAPLRRAWDLLGPTKDLVPAKANPDSYMWAWESEPASTATGILDDVTYDWLPLLERTITTGGVPIVAREELVIAANEMALKHTDIAVSPTGSAGLAGLLASIGSSDRGVAGGSTPIGRSVLGFTGTSHRPGPG